MLTPINTTYGFVTNGDFIDFFVNNNLACSLSKDSNCIEWYFDNEPGIRFSVIGGTYFTREPEDIRFDGVPLTTKEGFVTAIKAMFPVYAGGGGALQDLASVLGNGNSAAGYSIHNLLDPADPQDAATKQYVDNNVGAGIDDVLGRDQALTADRIVELNTFKLSFQGPGNMVIPCNEYADNAAALADNLPNGAFYCTNVGGEFFVKKCVD